MDFLKTLLDSYHLTIDEYKYLSRDVKRDEMPSPYLIKDMLKAKQIVLECLKNDENIMIYGDYDCDGIISTSILYKSLLRLTKNSKIGYYIPNRYQDKYGINLQKVQEIYEKGYKLLITVDNGITANEPLKKAKELGLKVIILDHHEYESDDIPEHDCIIHQDFSSLPPLKTSAGFLSFLFSEALLDEFNDYLFTLSTITLVTDMMPMKGYNHDALSLSMKIYKKLMKPYRVIDILNDHQEFDDEHIKSNIGPKINGVARIIEDYRINRLVKLFISDEISSQDEVLSFIGYANEIKKDELAKTRTSLPNIDNSKYSICHIINCKEGLIGIFSNSYLNTYLKPTCIFSENSLNHDILIGSMRTKEGFDIIDFYKYIKDILLTNGGHSFAGGLSIKKENYSTFQDRFEEYSKSHILQNNEIIIPITKKDISFENYEVLKTFMPFGEDFKKPLFKLDNVDLKDIKFSKNMNSIRTILNKNITLFGYFKPSDFENLDTVSLLGSLVSNTFNGIYSLQYKIETILK